MISIQKRNAELMFRVCSQVILSPAVTAAVLPPNRCSSHGCAGSAWVTSCPEGADPCLAEQGEEKSLCQDSVTLFLFDDGLSDGLLRSYALTYPLPAQWKLANLFGESLWLCTFWAASDCWAVPLVLTVHTALWLAPLGWSKERGKAKRSKWSRERVLPLPMKSHPKQFIWGQKGHVVE